MRQIKFRARLKDTNKVIEDFMEEYLIDSLNSEYFIVEQWTGLKDCKGKDIYEGDIIDKGKGEIFYDTERASFLVRWHDKVWLHVRSKNPEYYTGEHLSMNSHLIWEVIGNINSNPELLNN